MSFKLLEIGRCAEETQSVSKGRFGSAEPKWCASIRVALVAAAACVATAPTPSFAQTIDGDHTISADTKLTEDVTVNGQLILDGAAVDLNGHKITVKGGWSVSGEAGADGTDIVQNGSFETGFSTSSFAGWSDTSHPDNWTMTRGGVGCSRNGQPWIGVGVPNGTYVAYLQMGGTIEQTLTVLESGFYTMSFKYAARRDSSYAGGLVNVMFDNKVCFVDEFTRSATAVRTGTATVWLDAGSTVLQIRHAPSRLDASNDQSMWVDSVKVVKADVAPGIYGMATGAPGELRIETANAADVAATLPTVSGNVKVVYALTDDADWTAAGAINIPAGTALDLCGHTLAVAGLTGGGIVTDSANEYYTVQRDAAGNIYLQTEHLKATQSGVSNGSAKTQCIDTGYSHNKNTEVDLRISWQSTTVNGYSAAYGGRNTDNNTYRSYQLGVWVHNGKFMSNACAAEVTDTSTSPTLNAWYDVHISKSGQNTAQAVGSDTVVGLGTGNGLNDNKSGTDFMFAFNQFNNSHTGYWPSQCTIAYCKITEAGVAMREFVPARRLSDGEYGMFDTVRQEFLARANASSATFESGDYTVNSEAAAFGSSGVLRIAVPANTTLALDDMPLIVGDIKVIKEGAGVLAYNETTSSQKYFRGGYEDHSAPIVAVWTGDAGNNDFNDAANWSCTNDLGNALSGVAPDATTIKYILAADADWTAKGAIALGTGVTLDLNGNNLTATSITGAGIVVDSSNNYYTTLKDASGNFYVQLEYLASGTTIDNYNHGMEYIDTGYQHNTNTVVDMKVQILKTTTDWYCYYGARNGTANAFAGWIYRDNHYKGVTTDSSTSTPYPKNMPYLAHMEFGGTCTFGNASDTSTYLTYTSGAGGSSGRNDFMFALNQGSGNQFGFNGRIYYCIVKEKTDEAGVYTIKRDFVAAKRLSDGVLGMLDKENGVFYTNKGSGAFIAGPYATNGSATGAGELHITAAEGATAALGSMAKIVGGIKVVKDGAGTMTLPADGQYFAGGLEVAAGTLPMTQTAAFLAGTPITATAGGTITIAASDGASYTNDFKLAGGTLKVLASGTGNTTTAAIAGTLTLETGAADAQPVVSIDMTDCSSATFQLNTTALNVGSGVTAAPGFVSLADPTAYEASIEGGTAIKVESLTSPMTAVWTGLGEAGNFDDPGNWSCSNKYGVALANTLPDNTTLKFRLGADADWTAKGAITLGEGVTLDLNGQELIVANSVSGGAIIDTSCQSSGIYYGENGDVCLEATWLHSTSAGKQFIDTGYCHNPRTVVDMKVEYNPSLDGSGKWYSYFGGGGRNGSGSAGENYALGGWMINASHWKSAGTSPEGSWGTAKNKTAFTVHLNKSGDCTINGAKYCTGNGVDWGSKTPVTAYIFGHHNLNGTLYDNPYVGVRVYYCKISEGETVIRDFVPAMRITDGKPGMFDRKNNKFYVNGNSASTADFNIGTLAYSATGGGGELHITVAENATLSLADMSKIAGNVKIVKDGLGTLVAPTTGQYFTGGIEVLAGTLSMGGALAYGGTINAASGTTVSVPKSVGSAGTSAVSIAGGTLAVANCGTSVVTGTVTLGGNAISVAGSFAPVSGTAAHTITLADGATLDFTQWAGTFPVAYPTFAYASGANVTLKLEPATTALTDLARSKDAETGKRNGYLLSWDEPPSGVTFSSDAATRARFRVVPDESGLRMSFKAGFSIIIK